VAVTPRGVVIGDERWVQRDRVREVGVDRYAEPVHLPVAGDGDLHANGSVSVERARRQRARGRQRIPTDTFDQALSSKASSLKLTGTCAGLGCTAKRHASESRCSTFGEHSVLETLFNKQFRASSADGKERKGTWYRCLLMPSTAGFCQSGRRARTLGWEATTCAKALIEQCLCLHRRLVLLPDDGCRLLKLELWSGCASLWTTGMLDDRRMS
jgi:hypothetical protein